MSEAEKILKMIEEVDPDDTATLDEIDARLWCWLNNITFLKAKLFLTGSFKGKVKCWRTKEHGDIHRLFWNEPSGARYRHYRYTRSRDALKDIRPDGWMFRSYQDENGWYAHLNTWFGKDNILFDANNLPTEELAELHAIIQAIEYDRTNNQGACDE